MFSSLPIRPPFIGGEWKMHLSASFFFSPRHVNHPSRSFDFAQDDIYERDGLLGLNRLRAKEQASRKTERDLCSASLDACWI